jgi:hypothetical protein
MGIKLASEFSDDVKQPAKVEPSKWSKAGILLEVLKLVTSDRAATHGDVVTNHQNIARLWSAYLHREITADEVAIMMVLLKVARTQLGALNRDDYVDMAGYAAVAGEIMGRFNGQH